MKLGAIPGGARGWGVFSKHMLTRGAACRRGGRLLVACRGLGLWHYFRWVVHAAVVAYGFYASYGEGLIVKVSIMVMRRYFVFENMDKNHGVMLDEVLHARHTVRAFSPTELKKEDVEQIIKAGLVAPYAALPVAGKPNFRKFFVIQGNSPIKEKMKAIIVAKFPAHAESFEKSYGPTPFSKMLKEGGMKMANALLDKPCIILSGERWGVPAIAPESLSFCQENMWLKATTLKIGFQLLSVVSSMKLGNDKEFCQLLNIKPGEYYLDGIALGYPAANFKPAPVKYPDIESSLKWL
jgi:nitroreductase